MLALAPYGGHLISPDAWALKKIDSVSGATHTPNPAAATSNDLSLVIAGALASAVGASPLTYTAPEGWTTSAGASGGIAGGTTSGKSMGAVLCYQPGVTGTVTPGAMAIQGGSSATGTTNANLYHLVVKAPRQYKVGAFVNPAVYGTGISTAQAITNFQGTTGRTMEAHRIYYGVSGFPTAISTDMKADADAGRKICLYADTAAQPKPFGIWEFFTSLDPTHGQTPAQAAEFWGISSHTWPAARRVRPGRARRGHRGDPAREDHRRRRTWLRRPRPVRSADRARDHQDKADHDQGP